MSTPTAPADLDSGTDREFEELREILVGPERAALREVRARLDARLAAHDVAAVLPEAIAERGGDSRLVRALTPSVEEALLASARRDPRPLADALFPVLGPAIRNAITHALSALVESTGRVVEQSVSWRAIGWRLTAWRTGQPYAEVALLHTLLYQVEQVFLIHRETGLLLHHLTAPNTPGQSPDTVSAMLTAIRDFVSDSFGGTAEDAVDVLRVGNRTIFVEQGPLALLAAVVRGPAPPELRAAFQDALDTVHLQKMEALDRFDGDAAPFVSVRPVLEQCLRAQHHERAVARRGRRWLAALALLALAGSLWWGVSAWQRAQRDRLYLAALRAEPGLVVVSASRSGGRFVVGGLRDPLAVDPASLAAAAGMAAGEVEGRWTLYQALDPAIVLLRARGALAPPSGVSLTLRDGTLVAEGPADAAWIERAAQSAPLLAGVARFDPAPAAEAEGARLARAIEDRVVRFQRGTTLLIPGQDEVMRGWERDLAALDRVAAVTGRRRQVVITGHADSDGSPEANLPLSRLRAEFVRTRLVPGALAAIDVAIEGVGSAAPAVRGGTDADKARNRRVTLRVGPPAPAGPAR